MEGTTEKVSDATEHCNATEHNATKAQHCRKRQRASTRLSKVTFSANDDVT